MIKNLSPITGTLASSVHNSNSNGQRGNRTHYVTWYVLTLINT